MKKALITGVTGQDGSYLSEFLLGKGYQVFGVRRRSSTINTERISHLMTNENFKLFHGDMTDSSFLTTVLSNTLPDEIYNLAAQSHVHISFDNPVYTAQTTAIGALSVLEAMRHVCPQSKFYQASSSEMFGKLIETPQNENTPFYPRSPYGISKLFAHWATVNYREAYGLFACSGILFNHESPRRGENFVTRKISQAVAKIALGKQNKLYLGNLDAKRDWGYAGDYIEAMWLMLQQKKPDDYVVATGKTNTVEYLVDMAFSRAGLDYKKYVEIAPELYRPTEVEHLRGDAKKANEVLGWSPKHSFEELVGMMVDSDVAIENKK